MKLLLNTIAFLFIINFSYSQSQKDKEKIKEACIGYLEGFYEGDTSKIINSLSPTLHKHGFYKDKTTGQYKDDGYMTFDQAKGYAKRVFEKKRFARPDSPKEAVVLDIMNNIASAKVTAWWGTDYLLLSKNSHGKWVIEQVLWEGPLEK